MPETPVIEPWKVLFTLAHLGLVMGIIHWLDRREGKPALSWPRIGRTALLWLPLSFPFLAAYWFISSPDREWRQFLLVMPVFGPIFKLLFWGMWKHRHIMQRPDSNRKSQ
jgi:hypothetical protein